MSDTVRRALIPAALIAAIASAAGAQPVPGRGTSSDHPVGVMVASTWCFSDLRRCFSGGSVSDPQEDPTSGPQNANRPAEPVRPPTPPATRPTRPNR